MTLPDCAICGGPVRVELDGAGPVEECGWCGNRQRPIAPKPDRAEIRRAVRARRRLLAPACFGRRHHQCKASRCECACHDKTKGATDAAS